ncbi:hypothetical protein BG000_011599 [Podila horticola]|nr:hypothetical protein BG000_011599 [Podila horticola]
MQPLVVLCDGSWCGSEAETRTNIFQLARMIGIFPGNVFPPGRAIPVPHPNNAIAACYFPGVGLGGTFLEYLFNGATASDFRDDCIRVYRYIVQHYTPHHEVWMFGLSRGAYTVRCVAGMINNCGILRQTDDVLINQVFDFYRNRDNAHHPKSVESAAFRKEYSHSVATPVKFMGLFDTVGALGIPRFEPGIGLEYHEFYDTKVSCVVEKVYHAISMHDRLWGFEPCHALPDGDRVGPQFEIHERWFPGCHYDLGRQRFRFLRYGPSWLERMVGNILGPLSNIIEPNQVFADLVLKWMLEKIQLNDPQMRVIQNINHEINQSILRMAGATFADTGSGDIYNNLPAFGPAGRLWGLLTSVFPVALFPGFTAIINIVNLTIKAKDELREENKGQIVLHIPNSKDPNTDGMNV